MITANSTFSGTKNDAAISRTGRTIMHTAVKHPGRPDNIADSAMPATSWDQGVDYHKHGGRTGTGPRIRTAADDNLGFAVASLGYAAPATALGFADVSRGPFGAAPRGNCDFFSDFKDLADAKRIAYADEQYRLAFGIGMPARVLATVRSDGWCSKATVAGQVKSMPPTPDELSVGQSLIAGGGATGAYTASSAPPKWFLPVAAGAVVLAIGGAFVLAKKRGGKKSRR
jgi:hypothetical protein